MSRTRILIVEDELIVAADLDQRLSRLGYEIAGMLTRGDEAIAAAGRLRPDLVLMDIQLTGSVDGVLVDGVVAAQEIRRRFHIPTVFLSAYSDDATLARAQLAEPFGYLIKPFDNRELKTNIEMALYKHRVEDALRASEEKYRLLVENSQEAIFVVQNGTLRFVNRACVTLAGPTQSELLGRSYLDFIPETERAATEEQYRRLLNGPDTQRIDERRVIFPATGERWLQVNAVRILWEGAPATLNFATDISERRRAKEAAAAEAQRRQALFDASWDGIVVLDAQAKVMELNQRFADMIGCSREEALALHVWDWDCLWTSEELKVRVLADPSTTFETVHRRRDGSCYPVEISSNLILWQGNPLRCCVCRDITERQRREQTIREQRDQLSSIFRAAPIGIGVVQNRVFKELNERICEMTGYAREELLGQSARMLYLDQEEFERVGRDKYELIRRLGTGTLETRWRRKDGSPLDVQLSSSVVRPEDLSTGVTFTALDITDRKRSEAVLRESEANFRTFFETIGDMVIVATHAGRILFTNEVLRTKLGYTAEELARLHMLDLNPAEQRAEAIEIFAAILGKERTECPLPLVTREGRLIAAETRVWFGRWNGMDCLFGVSKDLSVEHEAKQRFELLFRQNPALMALTTLPDRKFADVNDTFLATLGYTRGEVIGRSPTELNLFVDFAEHRTGSETLLASGRLSNLELEVRRKDGTILAGLFSGDLLTNQGQVYALTVMIDITQRKRAEELLREKTEEVGHFFRSALDLLCIADRQSRFRQLNPEWENVLGYRLDELQGRSYLDLVHPDDLEATQAAGREAAAGKEVLNFINRYRRKDGQYRWIEWRSVPRGELIFATARDITDRKRTEEALQKLSRAVEQSPACVIITDLQGRIEYVNPRFCESTGYRADEALGQNPRMLKSGETPRAEYQRLWETVTAGGEWRGQFHNRRKNGELFWEQAAISPIKDEHGTITHFLAVKEDITLRKVAEVELRRSREQIRVLAARSAETEENERRRVARELHDQVGQTLTALGLNLSALRSRLPADRIALLDDSLALVEQTTESIRHVLTDLRPPALDDYGLIAALRSYGGQFSRRTGVEVQILAEEASLELAPTAQNGLFRIAQEALTNVAKHARAARVIVSVTPENDRVRMTIEDDGEGFAPPPGSETPRKATWGLISMAERALALSGECRIESAPGEGTRVIIEVPQ